MIPLRLVFGLGLGLRLACVFAQSSLHYLRPPLGDRACRAAVIPYPFLRLFWLFFFFFSFLLLLEGLRELWPIYTHIQSMLRTERNGIWEEKKDLCRAPNLSCCVLQIPLVKVAQTDTPCGKGGYVKVCSNSAYPAQVCLTGCLFVEITTWLVLGGGGGGVGWPFLEIPRILTCRVFCLGNRMNMTGSEMRVTPWEIQPCKSGTYTMLFRRREGLGSANNHTTP